MKREICVKVMFFAATADVVGRRTIEIVIPDGLRSKEFFDRIIADFPKLNEHRLLFALNQEYAKGDEILKDGDEVAIFTAVSGG